MSQPYVTIDAFTDQPFRGNPAAVCVLEQPRDDVWLQGVAREMNCAETAFLTRRPDGFGLRWFTPETEVPLCGHATLASAHALWEAAVVPPTAAIDFHTQSGVLSARRDGDWIRLSFPPAPVATITPTAAELDALGVAPVAVARNRFVTIAQLSAAATVRGFMPQADRLRIFPGMGIAITARSETPGFDIVSRFFAPQVGLDEDPATGGAHVALASFWPPQLGTSSFMAEQASARGGVFRVEAHADRIDLLGHAITTLRGTIVV